MIPYLRIYRDVVRPFAARRAPQPADKLFITASGEPNNRLGRAVQEFFKSRDLLMSTTTIRSIVETRADELFSRDLISVSN